MLCLLGILLLAGCKKETAPTTASTTTETVGSVNVNNLDFNYLSTKSQLSLNSKSENLSSGISLRIKKDSVIWASVQPGLGIEAARLKLTQDSVFVMDRLRKEYIATDYSYLRNKLNADISFDVLQAILLGNYQAKGAEKILNEGDLKHVQQLRGNLIFDYFIGNANSKLQRLNVQDKNTGNTIAVKYDSFQNIGAVPFAHNFAAQVLQKGEVSAFTLNHSRVSITDEQLSFPFSVPTEYKRLTMN